MGYRVWAQPKGKAAGYLEFGRVAPQCGSGTYYSHPSSAKKAAKSWVAKSHGVAEVRVYKTGDVVEVIYFQV